MDVLLRSLTWIRDNKLFKGDVRIRRGKIHEISVQLVAGKKERVADLDGHFLYPGLINAHDHLEMNLYPHGGNPPYKNYTEWARDIYKPGQSPVKEIESIPVKYRLLWGGVKNLISGATTVVHHNPWHRSLDSKDFPVHVLKKYRWAHSLAFDKKGFRNFSNQSAIPFIIHAAEGIDDLAGDEVRKLHDLGVLKKNTVLIHGVGLRSRDMQLMTEAQASLVWCPGSNLYMFGQTADIPQLRHRIQIALGSDSTMTGPATLVGEMQTAVQTGKVNAKEVFEMVTSTPAQIFNLRNKALVIGGDADLLILPMSYADYYDNLVMHNVQDITAVISVGRIFFGNPELAKDLGATLRFLKFGGAVKGIVTDLEALKQNILKKVPAAILEKNPLWQVLTGNI